MDQFYVILWSALGLVVSGLATWLTTFVVGWLNTKIKDKKLAMWSTQVFQIVMNAVQAVFQEFVDVAKKNGSWNEEKAKEAKERAYKIINTQLTVELKNYITENFGDIKDYIMNQIESVIYKLKK